MPQERPKKNGKKTKKKKKRKERNIASLASTSKIKANKELVTVPGRDWSGVDGSLIGKYKGFKGHDVFHCFLNKWYEELTLSEVSLLWS